VPALLTARSPHLRYPIVYAGICTILIAIGFFFPAIPMSDSDFELGIIRRMVTAFILWATMLLLIHRKQSEVDRRESEERFTSFMNNTSALAWMKDDKFRFVYVNQPFERFFGTTLQQLKGKDDSEFLPKAIAEEL